MYQYYKFHFHGYTDHAQCVMLWPRPQNQKRIVTHFVLSDDWHDQQKTDLMCHMLMCKFNDDASLRPQLVAIGDRPLFELSPVDTCWGTGTSVFTPRNILPI